MKPLVILFLLTAFCSAFARADWQIIKSRGDYGIADKGTNQGAKVGQLLDLYRQTPSGQERIGSVKVIRVTSNRCAVEAVALRDNAKIQVNDQLVLPEANPLTIPEPVVNQEPVKMHASGLKPVSKTVPKAVAAQTPDGETLDRMRKPESLKPWAGLNTGATIPGAGFPSAYGSGPVIGANYMVPLYADLYVGLEVNRSFISSSNPLISTAPANELTSSLLEGLVVGQKFFGPYFFMELGGGLYRPKVTLAAADGVKSSFSSTNFGIFGGTGIFVPTSQYAGFSLRARLHNYFDQNSHTYLGLAGGFRFQMQ